MKTTGKISGDPARRLDKAFGAMIGVAIGDSLGDAARTPENHFLYGITTGFGPGAAWSTDDTEFALLTAQLLIETGGKLTDEAVLDMWKRHVVTQDEMKRGGASEREAAQNIRRGMIAPETGFFNAYSLSDGAAMRATPIGIIHAGDPQGAMRCAEIESRISHSADGIWGSQAVAAAVSVAMADGSVEECFAAALEAAPEHSWLRKNLLTVQEMLSGDSVLEEIWMPLHDLLRSEYKAVVPEAVPSALAVVKLARGEFRRGILLAANFGRDTDTLAAIVGGITGSLHGASQIPPAWIEKCRYPTGTCLGFTKGMDIRKVAEELAALIPV